VLLVIFSILMPYVYVYDFGKIAAWLGFYAHYSDYTFEVGSNITIYILSVLYVFLLVRVDVRVFAYGYNRMFINMSTLFFVLVNLSVAFYPFYRLSILFILAIPLVFSLPLKCRTEQLCFRLLLIFFFTLYFFYFLYGGQGNISIIPDNIFTTKKLFMFDGANYY